MGTAFTEGRLAAPIKIFKNNFNPFTMTGMELESIMLSEIKSTRERQIPYELIHMRSLRNKTNKQRGKNQQTQKGLLENKLMICLGGDGRMGETGEWRLRRALVMSQGVVWSC